MAVGALHGLRLRDRLRGLRDGGLRALRRLRRCGRGLDAVNQLSIWHPIRLVRKKKFACNSARLTVYE